VLNVDGYEYSWNTDRLWRKNRQPTPVPFCTGIDPDHSWDYKWDAPGSNIHSSNPCSESPPPQKKTPHPSIVLLADTVGYRGEKPFQAIESALMSKYISTTLPKKHKIKTIAYLDFHSYSQSILYPFAYNCDVLPKDAEDIAEAAWGAAKAARTVHGRYFEVNSACEGDNFVVGQKREVSPPLPTCPFLGFS
jgi:extracellular matrix protein 14